MIPEIPRVQPRVCTCVVEFASRSAGYFCPSAIGAEYHWGVYFFHERVTTRIPLGPLNFFFLCRAFIFAGRAKCELAGYDRRLPRPKYEGWNGLGGLFGPCTGPMRLKGCWKGDVFAWGYLRGWSFCVWCFVADRTAYRRAGRNSGVD